MEFDEQEYIKDTVKGIYDDERYPRTKVIAYKGQISEEPDYCFCNPPHYSAKVPCLQQVIEELVEVKGLDNREELFNTYANFGKELFDKNISNLDSTRRLLKEKLGEYEKAYFMQTRPLMKFLVHEEIAEKIYSLDAFNYDKLASLLCFMNLLGFEKLLKEMDEVYEIFTSPNIGLKINEGKIVYNHELTADFFIPADSNYLLRKIMKGKDIVLKYNDLEYKLRAIDGILDKGIFDYTKTKVGWVSSDDIKEEVFKAELNSYLGKVIEGLDEPPKEKLVDWIEQIARSIKKNKNSEVKNAETIELYLKYFVNYPMSTVEQVKKGIKDEGNLPDSDLERLDNFSFNTFRGWEERFFEVLSSHSFEKYAQRFKRYKSSE